MVYEPFIRKAAGLGEASKDPDPARYDTRRAFTEVLVVGGGPAGLAAALAAARAGARVVLAEQDSDFGGSLLAEPAAAARAIAWRAEAIAELAEPAEVTLMTRTTCRASTTAIPGRCWSGATTCAPIRRRARHGWC